MSRKPTSERTTWVFVSIGALTVVAGVLSLFRAPREGTPVSPPAKVAVTMTSSPLVRDEAVIFDPAPLFLPTRFNASPRAVDMPEFGAAFPNYPAKLGYEIVGLKLDALSLPRPVAEIPSPAESPGSVLSLPVSESLVAGIGRTDAAVPALRERGGYVVISAADSGRPVMAEAVDGSQQPPGGRSWMPLEFAAAVDPAGMVGSLVLTVRSGVEEVDSHFQNHLVRTMRIGERLAPGFYRVRVGP